MHLPRRAYTTLALVVPPRGTCFVRLSFKVNVAVVAVRRRWDIGNDTLPPIAQKRVVTRFVVAHRTGELWWSARDTRPARP